MQGIILHPWPPHLTRPLILRPKPEPIYPRDGAPGHTRPWQERCAGDYSQLHLRPQTSGNGSDMAIVTLHYYDGRRRDGDENLP